ncbi:MAG: hypothetical protein Q9218_003787 [Villophora microphyllina]
MSRENSYPLRNVKNDEYVKYLKSIEDQRPEYTRFRKWLENNKAFRYATGDVLIHDSLSDNTHLPPISVRAGVGSDVQLLKYTLSTQPAGLRSRVVLVDLDNRQAIDQRILDVLRLSLGIRPLYFWSLLDDRMIHLASRQQDMLKMSYMALGQPKKHPTAVDDVSVGKSQKATRHDWIPD